MNFAEMKSRDDIGMVLKAMGLNGTGAEVGVAFGENAEQILLHSDLSCLLLVDPWNYVPDENPVGYGDAIKNWRGCFDYCMRKLKRFKNRITVIRKSSHDAAATIADESLDFAYIDANHMSPWIDRDLEAWWPKVKPGGVLGGHDFYELDTPGYVCTVESAVMKFFDGTGVTIHVVEGGGPSWYAVKP